MNFFYKVFYLISIALIIFSHLGCVADREFNKCLQKLEEEVACYKKIEPYFRNQNWTADEIIEFANELNNYEFENTKIIFQMLAHGYYLKGEYKKSVEMLKDNFKAEFACGFEIDNLTDQSLAAFDDCVVHLRLSQIYTILGEEDKSENAFNTFLELWEIACPCENHCEKKRNDFVNKYSW